MTPAPPTPFPPVTPSWIAAGTILHRIHSADYEGNSFNPCAGRPTRFAPLRRPDATCIATAYAAATLECAVHETVFHEVQHDATRKTVDFRVIEKLAHSTVRSARALSVVQLFEPDLNRWGLTRASLIDTFAADYLQTAQWAIAIHDAHKDVDGLVWTSRRCDPHTAFVLFGDRVDPVDLRVLQTEPVAGNDPLIGDIRGFGDRAGILLAF